MEWGMKFIFECIEVLVYLQFRDVLNEDFLRIKINNVGIIVKGM